MAVESGLTRRQASDNEIILRVLDVIERDPAITQRSVANELGIALGLANSYLKRCIRKGLVKVSQVPRRRYAYYLTPQGFAEKSRLTASYLVNSFSFFRSARAQCTELLAAAEARGQYRLCLIGSSELSEIASLVAREHKVRIVGIVSATTDPRDLAAAFDRLGGVDAAIVTTLINPNEVHAAVVSACGDDRVYVPMLLRVRAAVKVNAPHAEVVAQ